MYKYTLGGKDGKQYKLQVAEDRVVVRTKNARKLNDAINSEDGKAVMGNFDVEVNFPEADVSILLAKEDIEQKLAIRDKARGVLKAEPELRFAGRVLIDEESNTPVIYTENVFIKFKDEIDQQKCEKILEVYRFRIKEKPSFAKNAYFVSAPENTGLKIFELSQEILELPEVELCHPELVRQRAAKAIHPKQWHLKKTVLEGQTIEAHAHVEAAHEITRGKGTVIAIIDDGVDIDHPEFNIPGKVVHSRDATLGTNDPRPKFWDENHGTACAGVACAAGIKVSGVAPEAQLMPIRLASILGSFQEAAAIQWAVEKGADIISCSWGPTDGRWFRPEDPLHKQEFPLPDSTRLALDNAIKNGRDGKGCIICWAAGNGRENIMNDGYASYKNAIAVAACNDTEKRSVYSDFGTAIWCAFPSGDFEYQPYLHPRPLTKGIYTTDRIGNFGYRVEDYTDDFTGTSSSTPGVGGVAALILSVNPHLSWREVKNIIKNSCDKIDVENGEYDDNGHSLYYGYGRANAVQALHAAMDIKGASLTHNGQAADVQIIKAIVNPKGQDTGNEKVFLLNNSNSSVNLNGWSIVDHKKRVDKLYDQILPPNTAVAIALSKVKLTNTGGAIILKDKNQNTVNRVKYSKKEVMEGHGIVEF